MNWGLLAGLFFVLTLCSLALSKSVIALLHRRALFDLPNERSSHTLPTPRGGGLALVAVFVAGLGVSTALGLVLVPTAAKLLSITLFLATVSWIDDVRHLGPLTRFGSHILAVVAALVVGLVSGPFFGGALPAALELVLIGIGWVWFINLYNFMDGIDGLAATETIAIGLGGGLIALTGQTEPTAVIACLVLVAAAIGFLPFNWAPAKVFMGDVGSIPLGFVCAWILLSLAEMGFGAAAIILPLVFFGDATITLFKRLLRGEKIWQAHRQHFYQLAVQRGMSHSRATWAACVTNLGLIVLAVWSTHGNEVLALFMASVCVALLFAFYLKFPLSPDQRDTSE